MGDETKNDSEKEGGKLDKILSHLDSFKTRMDAADEERKADRARLDAACSKLDAAEEEKKKADAAKADAAEKEEKEKADKAKADAATEDEKTKKDAADKEEKEKADKARADAALATGDPALRARIAALEASLSGMPAHGSGDDRKPYIDAQVKAERVHQAFGDSAGAPPALRGESVDGYQRRLLSRFKQHSPKWKDKDLAKLDASVLDIAEEQIYADAMTAALHPADVPEGVLRRIESRDSAGRMRANYVGSDERAAWSQFTNGGMTGRFLIPAKH